MSIHYSIHMQASFRRPKRLLASKLMCDLGTYLVTYNTTLYYVPEV